MPITKAIVSQHICPLPNPESLTSRGYLPGTEWTCDECESVHVLSTEGSAGVYWSLVEIEVPIAPKIPDEPVAE